MSVANCWCEDCKCGAIGNYKKFQITVDDKSKKKKLPCPNNKKSTLKILGYKTVGGHIVTTKHAKGRSTAERNKRRTDDFEKNTLPTLTGFERRHFESKRKNKKK